MHLASSRLDGSTILQEISEVTNSVWILELHIEKRSANSLIMKREFRHLPALQLAIMENRGRSYVIVPPPSMTAGDRTALLDMRANGFEIEIKQLP
jgi:hypothetical protein